MGNINVEEVIRSYGEVLQERRREIESRGSRGTMGIREGIEESIRGVMRVSVIKGTVAEGVK